MKLDFLGRYKETSALIYGREALAKKNAPAEGFEKLIEGNKTSSQVTANTTQITSLSRNTPNSLTDTRASISFQQPTLIKPPSRIELTQPAETSPKPESAPSVKTPTLLTAKRISSAEELEALPLKERKEAVFSILKNVSVERGVDPLLGLAVVAAESNFEPRAVSKDGHGSKGLFQILDTTGRMLAEREKQTGEYLPFEPQQNLNLGVSYLRYLHEIFAQPKTLSGELGTRAAANSASLEKLAVAAFNAGEGRVASAQSRAERAGLNPGDFADVRTYLPETTKLYVDRVIDFKNQFIGENSQSVTVT